MPIFNRTDLLIEYLAEAIDSGSIGLPDLYDHLFGEIIKLETY